MIREAKLANGDLSAPPWPRVVPSCSSSLVCHSPVEKGPRPCAGERFDMHTMTLTFFPPKDIFSFSIALELLPEQGKCLLNWLGPSIAVA